MRRAHKKTCGCGQPASYSLASVLSTLGVSPRRQQCSAAVLFCDSCIHELCDYALPPQLQNALEDAYTAINKVSPEACDTRETQ